MNGKDFRISHPGKDIIGIIMKWRKMRIAQEL